MVDAETQGGEWKIGVESGRQGGMKDLAAKDEPRTDTESRLIDRNRTKNKNQKLSNKQPGKLNKPTKHTSKQTNKQIKT